MLYELLSSVIWDDSSSNLDTSEKFLISFKDIDVDHSMRSYLVDSASSRMLRPRTKPCKSKYESLYDETADGCLQQLWFL